MTDNEIIKDLQEEIHLIEYVNSDYSEHASLEMLKGCLNLINRQNAEIDRLKNELHGKVDYIHEQREVIDEKKAEIEKLKKPLQKLKEIGYCHNFQLERSDLVSWIYAVCDVIKVANKMTEGKNG